ncbi:hypothetical protein E2C01_078795 [Portunus trituberculatus]|uniref:Uncharacterized protein n=1 Tax=Portunus trituberculatus TaxID=210409 RepID=A0A5B7IPN9_PORTR|nr:hypothetical protein [Portunus trituberculatus]
MKTDYNSGVMETQGDFSIPLVGLRGPQSCYPALANDHTVTTPSSVLQHRGSHSLNTEALLRRRGH